MMRNVRPSARSAADGRRSRRPASGLTPAIGSSSSTSFGSVISARPSSRSFFWPPESVRGGIVEHAVQVQAIAPPRRRAPVSSSSRRRTAAVRAAPRRRAARRAAGRRRAAGSPARTAAESRARSGRCGPGRPASRDRARQPVMSRPSNTTEPRSGGIRPETQLKSVVLPAPFGPISPVIVPGSTTRSTPSSARMP